MNDTGTVNDTVVPSPGVLVAPTVPPWASTSILQNVSPSPVEVRRPPADLQTLLAVMHAQDPAGRIQDEQDLLRRIRADRAAVPAG